MKIVVCVKQVPEATNAQVDPATGTLQRDGVQSILNPFCEYALDIAVRLKQAGNDVHITAISMGPPQARDVLLRCLELGADESILVTDRKFAGADTWATAYTLSQVIRTVLPNYDLILVGKQAIDGDTAQVGPEIAEILGLPQISYGVAMEASNPPKRVRVTTETEHGYEVIEAALPALVTCSKGDDIRRVPSFHDLLISRSKPIRVVHADELNIPEEELGLQGSFTQVVKVFAPPSTKSNQILENLDAEQAARALYAFLKDKGFVG